ncbi:hypothetical protein [Candidatus Lokiarchaeum ossiferum]|uniref:hypothetical protein n=1 Tax=Candidatus Lokiarchaeum ossiferum TaxID=2951803 RepID=UPI00352D4752
MKKITHQFVNAGLSAFIFSIFCLTIEGWISWTIIGFLIGHINDIMDFKVPIFKKLGHRNKYTHGFDLDIIKLEIGIFGALFIIWGFSFGVGLFLMIILTGNSHVSVDSLTYSGINLNGRQTRGFVHYQDVTANGVIILIGIVLAVLGYLNFIYQEVILHWGGIVSYFN